MTISKPLKAIKQSSRFCIIIAIFTSCIIPQKVDVILHNATIISVDENNTTYEALAIKDGIIIDLGKENQILNKYSADQKIDAKKGFVYPGFIDSHCHLLLYGLRLQRINLEQTFSMNDVVAKCIEHTNQNNLKANDWIIGEGWDNYLWDDAKFPTNEKLNEAFPNNPVILFRTDLHGALANNKALELANYTSKTIVKGGHIEVLDGKLTGMIMDNAVSQMMLLIDKPTEHQKRNALLQAQQKCFEVGLTTVDEAGLNKSDVQLLEKMEKSGELHLNIYIMLSDNQENIHFFIDTIGKPYKTKKLHIAGFKCYSDGSLGSKSACLTKPYYDSSKTHNYGFLLNNKDYFENLAERLYVSNFQMCTHAIGDSAVRIILQSYANVLKGVNDRRWRIEHAQVVAPNDFEKFKTYTIIPSVQPTHATSDMIWAIKLLGAQRSKNSYAYKQLMLQNGIIALGTDFPVESMNPIETFYAAVARKNLNGFPKNGFQIENALSRIEALKGMTIWAAIANFEDKEKGTLEVGKRADFVILNQNILSCSEDDILKTYVKATYISGNCVYD